MLFAMSEDDMQNFWMKGMLFPIDIIWIENARVIGCEKNISPSDPRSSLLRPKQGMFSKFRPDFATGTV